MRGDRVARVRHEPAPLQCATFGARPARVVNVIRVWRAGQPDEIVYRSATLDSHELREVLPEVHRLWPREQGWAISIDAKVAHV